MHKKIYIIQTNSLLSNIGNFLILIALAVLFFSYYPLIRFYAFPQPQPVFAAEIKAGFFIEIPKIKAEAPILDNVDPWNEREYLPELKKGVAHAKGSALPGEGKTTYLFAHSSLPPWEMTRVNVSFLRLGELENGDEIKVTRNGKEYVYKVTDEKEVWPSDVQYLKNLDEDQLILQTCTPIGTSLKRLLIFAKPIRLVNL